MTRSLQEILQSIRTRNAGPIEIAGQRCIAILDRDWRDLAALCDESGIEAPAEPPEAKRREPVDFRWLDPALGRL
jgi:hypothetical protein